MKTMCCRHHNSMPIVTLLLVLWAVSSAALTSGVDELLDNETEHVNTKRLRVQQQKQYDRQSRQHRSMIGNTQSTLDSFFGKGPSPDQRVTDQPVDEQVEQSSTQINRGRSQQISQSRQGWTPYPTGPAPTPYPTGTNPNKNDTPLNSNLYHPPTPVSVEHASVYPTKAKTIEPTVPTMFPTKVMMPIVVEPTSEFATPRPTPVPTPRPTPEPTPSPVTTKLPTASGPTPSPVTMTVPTASGPTPSPTTMTDSPTNSPTPSPTSTTVPPTNSPTPSPMTTTGPTTSGPTLSPATTTVPTTSGPTTCRTISAIACNAPGFETLCSLLVQTGLDEVLDDPTVSITVFAPNNDAFNAVAEILPTLTEEQISNILLYHAAPGEVFAVDLVCGADLEMINGQVTQTQCPVANAILQVGTGNTEPGLPQITEIDIEACNGIVHVVNNVILPELTPNAVPSLTASSSELSLRQCTTISQLVCNTLGFETLCSLLVQTGLDSVLDDPAAEFTVFAPNNGAFDAIASVLPLLTQEDITDVLLYHSVAGKVVSADFVCGADVEMVNGQFTQTQCPLEDVIFQVGTGNMEPNIPQIITVDVDACNGVVHIVNNVVLPRPAGPTQPPVPTQSPVPVPLSLATLDPVSATTRVPTQATITAPTATPTFGSRQATAPAPISTAPSTIVPAPAPIVDVCADAQTITDIVCGNPSFSVTCDLLRLTGLDVVLDQTNAEVTLFAPNDVGWDIVQDDFPLSTLSSNQVEFLLLYHVTQGRVLLENLVNNALLPMLNGLNSRTFQVGGTGVLQTFQFGSGNSNANAAQFSVANLNACNGIVHGVTGAILPVLTQFPPVTQPVQPPVSMPVPAPVAAPTNSPVPATVAPVPAPTTSPVPAPVAAPTNSPVPATVAPVPAPIAAPTNSPVPAPVPVPTIPPQTPAPVPAPTPMMITRSSPFTLSYRGEVTDREALESDINGDTLSGTDPGLRSTMISYLQSFISEAGVSANSLNLEDIQSGQVLDPPVVFIEWVVSGTFNPPSDTVALDAIIANAFNDQDGTIDDYRTMFVNMLLPSSNYFANTTLILPEDDFPSTTVRTLSP